MLDYLENSTVITFGVLLFLSIYFVLNFWIFIYKYLNLNELIEKEKDNLDLLLSESNVSHLDIVSKSVHSSNISKEVLEINEINLIREASTGISGLSIIASTSPFIGLFGTVVGILESFSKFTNTSKVSFATIAPAISEALIATAAGIFVAIFAYSFHQIMTRKVYTYNTYIKSQINLILSRV